MLGHAHQQGHVTHRLSRRREQQALRRLWERSDAPQETLLDLAGQRPGVGVPEPTGQFGRGLSPRQLQQSEWVAAGLGDDSVHDALVEAPGHDRFQELTGVTRSLNSGSSTHWSGSDTHHALTSRR
jgi:hypothetical protein